MNTYSIIQLNKNNEIIFYKVTKAKNEKKAIAELLSKNIISIEKSDIIISKKLY